MTEDGDLVAFWVEVDGSLRHPRRAELDEIHRVRQAERPIVAHVCGTNNNVVPFAIRVDLTF